MESLVDDPFLVLLLVLIAGVAGGDDLLEDPGLGWLEEEPVAWLVLVRFLAEVPCLTVAWDRNREWQELAVCVCMCVWVPLLLDSSSSKGKAVSGDSSESKLEQHCVSSRLEPALV